MNKGIEKDIQQLDSEIGYHILINELPVDDEYMEIGEKIKTAATKQELLGLYGALVVYGRGKGLQINSLYRAKKKPVKSLAAYNEKRVRRIVFTFRAILILAWFATWITLLIISITGSNWEAHKGEYDYCCPFAEAALIVILAGIIPLFGAYAGGNMIRDHLDIKYHNTRRVYYA